MKELEFTLEEGSNEKNDVAVYALSTCGFCKRGINFLRTNSIKFRLLYFDNLPIEYKTELRLELEKKYETKIYFPFLVINDTLTLSGYDEELWKKKLL
jgi:glutaredoxin